MRIRELQLRTSDPDRQRDFYSRVLELPVEASSPSQFAVMIGSSRLVFKSMPQVQPCPYHFAFNIPEGQFAEAKAWLSARTALLSGTNGSDEVHFTDWQADSIYFLDPDGSILEFIARHRLHHPRSGPFTSADLLCIMLCISEIGLVVEYVPDFVCQIELQTGVLTFGDSSGESFRAVGDENGFFIVVKQERLWMPDLRVPAREAPLAVRFAADEDKTFLLEGPPYQIRQA